MIANDNKGKHKQTVSVDFINIAQCWKLDHPDYVPPLSNKQIEQRKIFKVCLDIFQDSLK